MPDINTGRVWGGDYLNGQLVINSSNLGDLTVAQDDDGSVLRDAIGAVDGVTADLDVDQNLIISSPAAVMIEGTRPLGADGETVENMHPGFYE